MKKPLPPTYFTCGLLAMALLHLLVPGPRLVHWPWRWLGVIPILDGLLLNLWADRLFKRHKTEVKPFRESTSLVVEGPFRISRNPMYLGGALIFIGAALLFGTVTPWIVVPVMAYLALAHFILPEEEDMERQFGEAYREYKKKVRRWI